MGKKRKKGGYYNEEYFFKRAFVKRTPSQTVVEKELTDELFDSTYASHRNPSVQAQRLTSKSPFEKEGVKNEENEERGIESQSTNVQLEKESIGQEKEDVKVIRNDFRASQEKCIEDLYSNGDGDFSNCSGRKEGNKPKETNGNEIDEDKHEQDKENENGNGNDNNQNDGSVNFDVSVTDDDDDNSDGISNTKNNHIDNKIEKSAANNAKKKNDVEHEAIKPIEKDEIDKEDKCKEEEQVQERKDQEHALFTKINENTVQEIQENEGVQIPQMTNPSEQVKNGILRSEEVNEVETNSNEEKIPENLTPNFEPQPETEVLPANTRSINPNEVTIDNREATMSPPQSRKTIEEMPQDINIKNRLQEIIELNPFDIKQFPVSSNNNSINNYSEPELPQKINLNEDIRLIIPLKKNAKPKNVAKKDSSLSNPINPDDDSKILNGVSTIKGKSLSMTFDCDYSNSVSMTEQRNTQSFKKHQLSQQEIGAEYRKTEHQSNYSTDILDNQKTFRPDNVPVINPPNSKDIQCCIII